MPVLDVAGVTKRYRKGPLANDDLTLTVEAGEVFGLLGPNGAGKTTLVGQILGLLRPSAGTITVDGVDVLRDPAAARQACSYQPQASVPVEGLSPREAIEVAGRIRGGHRSDVARRATESLANPSRRAMRPVAARSCWRVAACFSARVTRVGGMV